MVVSLITSLPLSATGSPTDWEGVRDRQLSGRDPHLTTCTGTPHERTKSTRMGARGPTRGSGRPERGRRTQRDRAQGGATRHTGPSRAPDGRRGRTGRRRRRTTRTDSREREQFGWGPRYWRPLATVLEPNHMETVYGDRGRGSQEATWTSVGDQGRHRHGGRSCTAPRPAGLEWKALASCWWRDLPVEQHPTMGATAGLLAPLAHNRHLIAHGPPAYDRQSLPGGQRKHGGPNPPALESDTALPTRDRPGVNGRSSRKQPHYTAAPSGEGVSWTR